MPRPFDPPPRRGLTRAEAAFYCGVSPSRFSQLVKLGTFPPALPGTALWDHGGLDAAFDRHSGLRQDETKPGDALAKWKTKRGLASA